ncbi:hypothetical protein Tdes44962_MAKER03331 [Teratosphaeria destructans]|uniref:Uncharacterized protein n=1 Tax=Teratosphaeria destructans TaxID=418781 RepID=A0A9W7SQA8_9PEZI|nr:hypothetical protein Tdes44962_MAKER03331 [Teratosphaeria destructans]
MAPIRRYLRITKYSVLEVRIYLDKPSEAPWLLSARDPVLPRIIEAVRPQVLPKLREENENAKKKGGRKKRQGIKDVTSQHDFDVTIFLTESSSRHSLLTKRKRVVDKPRLTSTGRRLTGWLDGHSHNDRENPIAIDEEEVPPDVLQEVDDVPELRDIPEATDKGKRQADPDDDDDDALSVSSSDDEASSATQRGHPQKRKRRSEEGEGEAEVEDEKKKLGLTTSYDGFSIYGRILCLVVKRKGPAKALPPPPSGSMPGSASQMMERWVSTQAAQEAGLHDEDEEEEG